MGAAPAPMAHRSQLDESQSSLQLAGAEPSVTELPRYFRAPYQPPLFPYDEEHEVVEEIISHKPLGFTYSVFRWPLLCFIIWVVFIEMMGYIILRMLVYGYEMLRKTRSRRSLNASKTLKDWREAAIQLDKSNGKEVWRAKDSSPFYDCALIKKVVSDLRATINDPTATPEQLANILMTACRSNLGGVENEQLYSHTYFGTKHLIHSYVDTVTQAINKLGSSIKDQTTHQQTFRKLSKAYGRTALCLSGGASFGYYHLGVVKALLENDTLPQVISGTSAGSLIGAFVCCRTDAELKAELNPGAHVHFKANDEPFLVVLRRLWKEGCMFDTNRWIRKMQEHICFGDMTFLEAYQKTNRILNICVASNEKFSPPFCLNYKTTPNVVVWSAVLASAAVPVFLHAMELKEKRPDGTLHPYHGVGKRWRDGVLRADIPLTALQQLFGVNYTVVSQVNPHVVPFFYENRGSGGRPTLHLEGHGWRGGFVSSFMEDFLKLDMRKWLQLLQDLHILPRVLGQDWSYVFLQQFGGTVTIVPPPSFFGYLRVIFDPDANAMGQYIAEGEAITWPKLSMITNRLRIEKALQKQLQYGFS